VFGALFLVLALAFFAAPLYASEVAHTTYAENRLSDEIVLDGKRTFVVSLVGVPIGPTWEASYFLGADENGRDLIVRLLYGGRNSLVIGAGAVLLTLVLGVPLALMAGYFRGRVDALITRLFDLIWSFPALLLGVLLGTAVNLYALEIGPVRLEAGSLVIPIAVSGIVYVPYLAGPLRRDVLALREQPFVEAARACGMGPVRIMLSELLPHLWSAILVLTPLLFANAVVLESALSFLGAGVQPPQPSFGTLIAGGVHEIAISPHLLLAPSIALVSWCSRSAASATAGAGRSIRTAGSGWSRRAGGDPLRCTQAGWALLTALIASIAAFAMFWAIPNVDPEYWLGGAEKGNDATRARAIEQYGLDDPLPVQYLRMMDQT
jgi:peptide/nickel transport system permease protein